ncbi:unnamed protein product [Chrysodeixis includens]|uniref:Sm domain-containing protein n=1 Tax=Chrysodeixis includens TaxID=689277 RepID=A0A9N8KSG9_CHRIL|nr:unnamed protein product [Chrysodeixis includens]
MTISTRTLVQVAAWGGLVVAGTGFYLQQRVVDRVRSYDYYKHALKKLRAHSGAVQYLGEPIKDRRFKLSDSENNFSDGKTARFSIPVSGPKDRGTYYFWAERNNEEWKITRAELELKSNKDARLAMQGKNTTVDLLNDSCICGLVVSVDGYMNMTFENAVYCDPQGNEYYFENIFLQSRNIRYVHVPEDISILSAIKKEIGGNKKRIPDKKAVNSSRKVKKALKQHMDTVASLE